MGDSGRSADEAIREALQIEYGQVCNTFRTLTEIRFKLLAFLPLAAGVTTAFARDSAAERFLISLFGLAATVGLSTYNARNDQLYDELVGRAAEIERRLGLPDGAFANRPRAWLTLHFGPLSHEVGHRAGVGIIYAASFGLWLYGLLASGLLGLSRLAGARWPALRAPEHGLQALALALSVLLVLWIWRTIGSQRKRRRDELRAAAAQAVAAAQDCPLRDLAERPAFVAACVILGGTNEESVKERLASYAELRADAFRFYAPPGQEASYIVALLTDMPPRWISDCASGRRR